MARPVSMKIGTKFGMLTALERAPDKIKAQTRWLCRCDCGNLSEVYATHLRSGNIKSCGCNRLAAQKLAVTTHGKTKTPTHVTWQTMKQRCLNPRAKDFHKYGGSGITVCDRWLSFDNFFADMGERPEGMTLDRIDNSGSYSPDNCRWATPTEQQANRKRTKFLTYNGETLPMSEWARRVGMRNKNLYMRIRYGWTPAQALGFETR